MSQDTAPTGVTATATTGSANESLLAQFSAGLAEIVKSVGHDEMWGVTLKDASDVPTSIVLTKFLRANTGDLAAAKKQLTSALEWRKKMQPLELVKQSYDEEKFGGLGYVTVHEGENPSKPTIISWNIYGAVKDNKKTFGDVEEFIKWRAALMEMSVHKLNLPNATEPIPADGEDQYQMIQVHDYLSVSFFRPDPNVKKASQEAIRVFSLAYPEVLAHKYFVNVPALMGWMYGLMKLFVAPATLKKFHPMSSGTTLATELPGILSTLPAAYGGKGPDVKTAGETVNLTKEPVPDVDDKKANGEAPAVSADDKKESSATVENPTTAEVDDTKPTESKIEEPQTGEAVKPADLPNPLGSAPVQPIPETKPAEEASLVAPVAATSETEAAPPTVVKPGDSTPEVKVEGTEEKK